MKNGDNTTVGFVRDPTSADEFYLEIVNNQDSSQKLRIAVVDIDEFEHVEGTLKFYIYYQ
jgi:hypothetical protein